MEEQYINGQYCNTPFSNAESGRHCTCTFLLAHLQDVPWSVHLNNVHFTCTLQVRVEQILHLHQKGSAPKVSVVIQSRAHYSVQ